MLNKQSARVLAHKAICLIALEKKSLSESLFSNAEADLAFAKSLVFGSIRFYHHLNDIITPRIKKPLDKENLDLQIAVIDKRERIIAKGRFLFGFLISPAIAATFITPE